MNRSLKSNSSATNIRQSKRAARIHKKVGISFPRMVRGEFEIEPGKQTTGRAEGEPGTTVTITLKRKLHSGGHHHGGEETIELAVGKVEPNRFVLGSSPTEVDYTAPDVCGEVLVEARFSSGVTDTNTAKVRIKGLVKITESATLKLKPPETIHPSPYWATPAMVSRLSKLANMWFALTTQTTVITDASLEWGGRFDTKENWKNPHKRHMFGLNADIRSRDMNKIQMKLFPEVCKIASLTAAFETTPPHWHVSYGG